MKIYKTLVTLCFLVVIVSHTASAKGFLRHHQIFESFFVLK